MSTIGRSDSLGRYYTKPDIGALLVDQMENLEPTCVLDLGAGAGSLSQAALKRWNSFDLLTVDVDSSSTRRLKKLISAKARVRHTHISADALSVSLPKLIGARADTIDAAVCNPPFITPKWRKGFAEIIEDAGFSGCLPVLSDVDAALLFLAQNLRLLNAGATLGIILPDTLISASKYKNFRKLLLKNYSVEKAIRLPRGSFLNTDAQAYIVVVSKGGGTKSKVPLQYFDNFSSENLEVLVDIQEAIERLDYGFHAVSDNCKQRSRKPVPLGELSTDLKRGTLSSAERLGVTLPVLHTTDIGSKNIGVWCDFPSIEYPPAIGVHQNIVQAIPGDLLIARVGRNLEQKILGVRTGNTAISDCIYRLRIDQSVGPKVMKQLLSPRGQAWLKSRAYGVSAKQLTKTDLLAFPLNL